MIMVFNVVYEVPENVIPPRFVLIEFGLVIPKEEFRALFCIFQNLLNNQKKKKVTMRL